jgi:hypothetical protein
VIKRAFPAKDASLIVFDLDTVDEDAEVGLSAGDFARSQPLVHGGWSAPSEPEGMKLAFSAPSSSG